MDLNTRVERITDHGLPMPLTRRRLAVRPLRRVARLTVPLALGLLVAGARRAPSLPLFASGADARCDGCHTVVPRLSPAGIAFEERGYRGEGGAPAHAHAFSIVGGTGLALSHPRPRGAADLHVVPDGEGSGIHAAGATGHLTYHVNVAVARAEDEPQVRAAFAQLDDLAGAPLDLRAGRFDAELPFLSRTGRTTLVPYLAPTSIDARGLELRGRPAGWTWATGLAFSDRRISGGVAPRRIAPPLEDTWLRMTRTIGGGSLGAQFFFDRQDSPLRTLSWVQHLRGTVAASVGGPRLTIVPAYVFDRFDDRPAAGIHERHQFVLLEAVGELDPRGRFSATVRWERDARTRNVIDPEAHRQLDALDLAWHALPNAQLAVEWANRDARPARPQEHVDAFVRASW